MRVKICSILLAFVLGCSVSAGTKSIFVEEKQGVRLPCPEPVEGSVTWSRRTNGSVVKILTSDPDKETRHNDPGKRYNIIVDKFRSLFNHRAVVSDSGRYFCNNQSAVDLTVIPSGTELLNAIQRTSIPLICHAAVSRSQEPKWVRQIGDKNNAVGTERSHIKGKILTLTDVQTSDSGLYSCNDKPVAYLNVLEDKRREEAAPTMLVLVLGVVVPLVLVIVIILFLVWICKFKTRAGRSEQGAAIYVNNPEESTFERTQDGSSQHDVMYTTIQHQRPAGNNNVVPQPKESIYSLIKTNN